MEVMKQNKRSSGISLKVSVADLKAKGIWNINVPPLLPMLRLILLLNLHQLQIKRLTVLHS
jgi:hypothetical protein